jgi:hypothetical protein
MDTKGSSFDTVIQISTGSTLAGQTVVAFNNEAPNHSFDDYTSRVSFMAVAGTVYNIAVGGLYYLVGAENGDVSLHIVTGTAAVPAYFPVSLSFSPPAPDVTSAAVNVTAPFVIQSSSGTGSGVAGVGFGWENTYGDGNLTGPPAFWNAALPQSGSPQLTFTIPRFSVSGDRIVWFKIIPDSGSPPLIFTGPDGGSGYAMPPPPGVVPSIQIINNGPADEDPPFLNQLTITGSADVTTSHAALQISAKLTDSLAGVASVKVSLASTSNDQALRLIKHIVATLTLTSGTAQNGTWSGPVMVPLLFPTGFYGVTLEATDAAGNSIPYGQFATYEIPGGNPEVGIIGGGAYEQWAYSYWFDPGDANPGIQDDADRDGKSNLVSYAFDLNPRAPFNSTGSLPVVDMTGTGAARHLRLSFLRRKSGTGSGMTYSPQFTSNPSGIWQTVSGGSVTPVDSTWERVVIEDTVNVSAEARRFARVAVEYVAP